MKISFAICTHNEGEYINKLLTMLSEFIMYYRSSIEYEIVVVDDYSTDEYTKEILNHWNDKKQINLFFHALNNNYSEHKNFMNSCCTGNWILNLDADEIVNEYFLNNLSSIIEMNPDVDSYWIPRVNTVDGLTLDHIRKWGWVITKSDEFQNSKFMTHDSDEYKLLNSFNYIISEIDGIVTYYQPIVAWPDMQMRLYKNDPNIHWTKPVHEQLVGYKTYGVFPQSYEWAILHHKTIKRQEEQNNYYERLLKNERSSNI